MKKMYFLTIALIVVISLGFIFFSNDINAVNERFAASFGLVIDSKPVSFEEITIPQSFDNIYENYNLLQNECGLDLSEYKNKRAIRYTYTLLNYPENIKSGVFVTVICVNGIPIAGDIICPAIDGFIKPLNFLQTQDIHDNDISQ